METSFANGGQISAGHAEPWAKPSVAAEDPALARARGRAAAVPAARRPGAVGVGRCASSSNACPGASSATAARLPGSPATAATACARCARAPASATTSWRAASCISPPSARDFDALARTPKPMRALGIERQVKSAAECLALEPALRHSQRSGRRRRLHAAATNRATRTASRSELARLAAARGVGFRFGTAVERSRRRRGQVSGVRLQDGERVERRRLCRGPRQLQPAAARAARHPHSGLSAEGLLDHACRSARAKRRPRRA